MDHKTEGAQEHQEPPPPDDPVTCELRVAGEDGFTEAHGGLGGILLVLNEDGAHVSGYISGPSGGARHQILATRAWIALGRYLNQMAGMPVQIKQALVAGIELGDRVVAQAERDMRMLVDLEADFPLVLRAEREGRSHWRRLHEDGSRDWADTEQPEPPAQWQPLEETPAPPALYVSWMLSHGWAIWKAP